MFRWRRLLTLLPALATLVVMLTGTTQAALLDFGPPVPVVLGSTGPNMGHGFPAWFRDSNRVPLQLCVEVVPGCLLLAADLPNPALPPRFPDNMPGEIFYHSAEALIGNQLLFTGVEMNFVDNGDGTFERVGFARVRIRIDTTVAGDYTVTTPYKQYFFTVTQTEIDATGGRRVINATEDLGLGANGDFTGILSGSIDPFVYSQNAPFITPNGSFLGDGTPRPLVGSKFTDPVTGQPANIFRIEGPPGFTTVSTNLFSVTGKLYDIGPVPTPLTVDKVTYSRNGLGMQYSTFATTQPLSNQTVPTAPFPQNFALTGALSALEVAGTNIPTLPMTTNNPEDGKFFATSGVVTDPGTLPATVTVTNTADTPVTTKVAPFVDEIVISEAVYNPATGILRVVAASGDAVTVPTLQLFYPGEALPAGTLANGQISVQLPLAIDGKSYVIPPPAVIVNSSLGGSATAEVSVPIPPITHNITATAAANGTITPAGVTAVETGAGLTYTITPNQGYTVVALVVDGQQLPGATSYTFSNVSANHYINAYFTAQTNTIVASAGANGAVSPAGNVTVPTGGSRSFTFTPNPGFRIANLVADGVTMPAASSYTFTSVTGNHTISANFTNNVYPIAAAAAANGTISPAGTTQVAGGGSQTYTITPNPGYSVSALVVDGQKLAGATSYTFSNVSASHYINAYFAPTAGSFTITAAAAPNGSISPAGATIVAGGLDQTYTITPNTGFVVSALVVDGVINPAATSYTFTNILANHYINAYFAPAP